MSNTNNNRRSYGNKRYSGQTLYNDLYSYDENDVTTPGESQFRSRETPQQQRAPIHEINPWASSGRQGSDKIQVMLDHHSILQLQKIHNQVLESQVSLQQLERHQDW
ncbi:unnamed protein product [Ambrosiozyma monospora]|uniref:Unnamed protein product n=1 Tax=Ambrosiozyma monospora TaxID=43982 RepID=A0ACB5SVI2_AMBMO|nr:unnamed protein product [Ambrosiozyma monospora]